LGKQIDDRSEKRQKVQIIIKAKVTDWNLGRKEYAFGGSLKDKGGGERAILQTKVLGETRMKNFFPTGRDRFLKKRRDAIASLTHLMIDKK